MPHSTEQVVRFYADSWIGGDLADARRVLAADAEIGWNLDAPVDDEELLQTLHRIAAFADSVRVVTRTCSGDRAAVVYDCVAPFGTVRVAEFLTVDGGRISQVRQVYDAVALRHFFPGLLD